MEEPTNGGHLQQFLCALQWVRSAIPQFNKLTEPLHIYMERVFQISGRRTKRSVSQVNLNAHGWSKVERDCFERCKKALAHQVTRTHRDESKRLCVYTDASDHTWSGIMTQIPLEDMVLKHSEQKHELLAFLSGRFNETQLRWSILEKEGFAIIVPLEKVHWMCATPSGFDLFTNHNNLIFLFN